MSALNVQNSNVGSGSSILPSDQVKSDNGMLFSLSNLSVFNTEGASAYSLDGNLKVSKIQSQSSTSGILQSNAPILQIFTISNNLNSVHKINSVAIQFTVTNTYSASISFNSALSAIRTIEILIGGSTVVTLNAANILEELMYLSEDHLIPVAQAMGINYNPATKSFTEGFVLGPGKSRVLMIPIFCPIINKLFMPVLNEQVSYRCTWNTQDAFYNPPITGRTITQVPVASLPVTDGTNSISITAYVGSTNTFTVDNFNLFLSGWQFFGDTYNRVYADNLGKNVFHKILIPRSSITPLSTPPVGNNTPNTFQLSILSGKFISLAMWINASTINSNVSIVMAATQVGVYMDGYNVSPANPSVIYQTQVYATPLSIVANTSGTFPTYFIPNKKAGMSIASTTLLDSSGTPVLGVQQIPVEYQTDISSIVNRSPLQSILPIASFSFDEFESLRFDNNSYLSSIQTNGLFTIQYTLDSNYFYTGVSGQVNTSTACSLYISAHQLGLASVSASGGVTIINL